MINDKLFWNEDIKNDENDINKARYSPENTTHNGVKDSKT